VLAWLAMLALTGKARPWEPKRLRLRLLTAAGTLVRGGRHLRLRLARGGPWNHVITPAITRLQGLAPGSPAGPQRTALPGDPARPRAVVCQSGLFPSR
jgi:hypothetical protein